jgi:glutamyl-tRNA synthetase
LPLVLGTDKKRLSKRHAATNLEEYREEGYLDSAIINTLARLGWSKGDEEVFYLDDLIKNFNIKEVQKAGAIFDITKLDWVNSQHLANLSIDDFKSHLKPFLKKIDIEMEDHSNLDLMINAMRSSENTLSGIAESLIPYFKDISSYDTKAMDKFLSDGTDILTNIKDVLLKIDDWNENNIDAVLKTFQTNNDLPVPKVNQPIRIALTGSTKSPSLGLTLSIFGKDQSITRIQNLIDTFES